jgi:hypothetical protein
MVRYTNWLPTTVSLAVHHKAATTQILDFSVCVVGPTSQIWTKLATYVQIMHATAVCILALVQFVRQSLQMYRVTKQWQINRYMGLLVREGILYFLVYVPIPPHRPIGNQLPTQLCHSIFMFTLINLLSFLGEVPTSGWQAILLFLLAYVPLFTQIPRFIMSIREMYAHGARGGRGDGIDTGFGLTSSGRDAGRTAIVFADVQDEGLEDIEEIPMEVGTIQAV